MMKTRIPGVLLLVSSGFIFSFALNTAQRDTATACWVVSTLMFIGAAMLLLKAIVGSSTVTAGDPPRKRRQ
ncbi:MULTISPECIES: hypothetical protein [Glutamicibacter]|nr:MULTISPECIES: hypothetical protein [Glutamicibacter]KWR71050.1 hypothetical protein RN04_10025 [Arthrobacter sp. W1]MBM7767134.1 hypothetical protein [Glutamicibacter nicotianae]QEP06002.1 hypothetical protein F0M17_01370 [Glutamicibacter sp. ZJUTW]UTM48567.1 hypothetical protein XH9_07200 [Glutamicibacter mysorens]WIV44316.1 hypothetical protein QQS42_01470 [Glutamicibacter nicotianae]